MKHAYPNERNPRYLCLSYQEAQKILDVCREVIPKIMGRDDLLTKQERGQIVRAAVILADGLASIKKLDLPKQHNE